MDSTYTNSNHEYTNTSIIGAINERSPWPKCFKCYTPAHPKIFLCQKGHLICNICYPSKTYCYNCDSKIVKPYRNLFLERLYTQLNIDAKDLLHNHVSEGEVLKPDLPNDEKSDAVSQEVGSDTSIDFEDFMNQDIVPQELKIPMKQIRFCFQPKKFFTIRRWGLNRQKNFMFVLFCYEHFFIVKLTKTTKYPVVSGEISAYVYNKYIKAQDFQVVVSFKNTHLPLYAQLKPIGLLDPENNLKGSCVVTFKHIYSKELNIAADVLFKMSIIKKVV